jgi:hypothetical protein
LIAKRESSNRFEGQVTGITSYGNHDGKNTTLSLVGSISTKAPISLLCSNEQMRKTPPENYFGIL